MISKNSAPAEHPSSPAAETRIEQAAARMRLAAEVEMVKRRLDRDGGAPLEKAADLLKPRNSRYNN